MDDSKLLRTFQEMQNCSYILAHSAVLLSDVSVDCREQVDDLLAFPSAVFCRRVMCMFSNLYHHCMGLEGGSDAGTDGITVN